MTTPTTERAAPAQGEGVNPQAGGASMRVDDPILQVRDLVKHFPVKAGLLRRTVAQVHAVCGLSLGSLAKSCRISSARADGTAEFKARGDSG